MIQGERVHDVIARLDDEYISLSVYIVEYTNWYSRKHTVMDENEPIFANWFLR